MKYQLVIDDNIPRMIEVVNALMTKGWRPVGGVTFDKMNRVSQAMVLEVVVSDEPAPLVARRTKKKDTE